MSEHYNINEQIRRSMLMLEMEPQPSSFGAILKKLEKKKRRRGFFLLFFGLGFLAGGCLYLFNGKTVDSSSVALHSKHAVVYSKIQQAVTSKETNMHHKAIQKKREPFASSDTPYTQRGNSKNQVVSGTAHDNENSIPQTLSVNAASSYGAETFVPAAFMQDSVSNNEKSTAAEFSKENSSSAGTSFVFLSPQNFMLPVASAEDSLTPAITASSLNKRLQLKNRKPLAVMIGVAATPQWGSYLLEENSQHSAVYGNSPPTSNPVPNNNAGDTIGDFSTNYLKGRKQQNRYWLHNVYSLKLGLIFDDTWELWLSYGQQQLEYDEKFYNYTTGGSAATTPGNPGRGLLYSSSETEHNVFHYRSYSVVCNRIIQTYGSLRLKLGLGLSANKISWARYAYVSAVNVYYYNDVTTPFASQILYTMTLNAGIIKSFGKRFQLRVSPGIFYSPNSMFSRNYVIRQKVWGLQAECALAFRLFKI